VDVPSDPDGRWTADLDGDVRVIGNDGGWVRLSLGAGPGTAIERAQQLNSEGRCVLLDVKTCDELKMSVYPLK